MLLILALLAPVFAATLRGFIPDLREFDDINTVLELRDIETLERDFRHVSQNGSFAFYNLDEGKQYRLSLTSDTINLDWSYLVTVKPDSELAVRRILQGRPVDAMGPPVDSDPLVISGYNHPELVADRNTFSIFGFITQTSVLLSVGALVLVTYLPTLLDNLDPELMAELQKNQLGGSAPQQDFDLAKKIADSRVKK